MSSYRDCPLCGREIRGDVGADTGGEVEQVVECVGCGYRPYVEQPSPITRAEVRELVANVLLMTQAQRDELADARLRRIYGADYASRSADRFFERPQLAA